MPIASLTTGEIETRAMGNEFGAGHFLSAPYFQNLDNPTNQKFVEGFLEEQVRQERHHPLQHGRDLSLGLRLQEGGWRTRSPPSASRRSRRG